MTEINFKRYGGKVLSALIALTIISSVFAGGVMAADGDADETITVGSSGDYTTIQEAVDNADSSVHTHIEITVADVSGSDASVRLTNDDVYFQAATSGNTLEIDTLENPYNNTYGSSSDISFTNTIEGETESYTWTVGSSSDYSTIQTAVDNATQNDTVSIEAGSYDENVTLETEGLTLESQSSSDVNVTGTLDATNVTDYTLGDYVTFDQIEDGSGGGGSGSSAFYTQTYYGIPLWVYGIAAVIVAGGIYQRSQEE